MDIRLEDREGVLVIRPVGELTSQSAANLQAVLSSQITKATPTVVMDASGLSYMDSAGLGALVSGLNRAREFEGKFLVCGLQEEVRTIFELTRMTALFKIFGSLEEAVTAAQT